MEATKTLEDNYAPTGYQSKKVVASVLLAAVLHVVVLGAYFILGSSKKMSAPAAAAKPGEGDAPKPGTPPKEGATAAGSSDTKTPATGDNKPKVPDEIKKSTDVAKPGEIPSKPDTDIDEILKRK